MTAPPVLTAPPVVTAPRVVTATTQSFRVSHGRVRSRLSTVDNDLGDLIVAELGPLGLVPDAAAFEAAFVSAVLSTHDSPEQAWLGFYRRSLVRLDAGPDDAATGPHPVAEGPHRSAGGPDEAATGPHGAAEGPDEAVTGPRRAGGGPDEAVTGPHRAVEGPHRAAGGPDGAATGVPGTAGGMPETGPGDGTGSLATFGRIYRRAATLLPPGSVLDVGSCFGFFPLFLRRARPDLAVLASDLVPGTAALAARMAALLHRPMHCLAADATRLPLADRSVDAVILLHVLEHLPAPAGAAAVAEALRVARQRVVLAVPLEPEPDPTYGHVVAFTLTGLADLGAAVPQWSAAVAEGDGGWLVLDRC